MPRVCLDAGHGGKDSGATGYGRLEKTDVLNMVLQVGKILTGYGVTVYYTRKTDVYDSPVTKARKANDADVDFFASFHRNAATGSAHGYETLVYANSGAAKTCAEKANAAMAALGFTNRGTKVRKDLAVLNTTTMQAVLFEIGFIDNKADNDIFTKKNDDIAKGLAGAIAVAVGVKTTTAKTPVKTTTTKTKTKGTQATAFKGMATADIIKKVGPLFSDDQRASGVLASVGLAQFCLESAYGTSELAQKANNCFGMKKNLSGNTWEGSTWDGKSVYKKQTGEQKANGQYYTITAEFRKYSCIEDSIADHSAYLLGAKNGSKARYAGLKGCADYKKAAQIIKDGGYATSHSYVKNLCAVIEKWNLTQYDVIQSKTPAPAKKKAPSRKSITTIAKEVIDGKWGNGEDRKKKLTAAGYDYKTVQKKVNELLK